MSASGLQIRNSTNFASQNKFHAKIKHKHKCYIRRTEDAGANQLECK
jgi:hypothetical protein